jgi:bacillolysin
MIRGNPEDRVNSNPTGQPKQESHTAMKIKTSSKFGFFNTRVVVVLVVVLGSLGASLGWLSFGANQIQQSNAAGTSGATAQPANAAAQQALTNLQSATRTQMVTQVSRQTGNYNFVKAPTRSVLVADKASGTPETRARAFLASQGALVGINDGERATLAHGGVPAVGSDLHLLRAETDSIGMTHVHFDQFYRGLRVLGARLVVHMNSQGITGVNGDYVPNISVSTAPVLTEEFARQSAVTAAGKNRTQGGLRINKAELGIYPLGLLEGFAVQSRLAYAVEVSGDKTRDQVWIDANSGAVLNKISLRPDALFRIAYSPQYDPSNPNMFILRQEGDPPVSPVPGQNSAIDNLYDFTGYTYNFYASAFGRDSYDAAGKIMRTVLLVNSQCPNAYWDGSTTNYCPDFDEDDVVSHEWSHAYTEYTHGLIYSYQSGALNESYSDIFGETVDLLDGVDGSGGNDNVNHAQYGDNGTGVITKTGGGERFQLGEDFQGLNQPAAGILRDMYTPTAFGNPDKVTSPLYSCGADDSGGVHNNSGVPNHAYALAVDGGTFNGQTNTGIGLTKAAAIWFRAESVYQTPTTNFPAHQQAIETSCNDLIGQNIYIPRTDSTAHNVSPEKITAQDCVEVHKAMLAVEMSSPIPCNFPPLLDPATPALCSGSQTIYSENWESGTLDGWTLLSVGEENNAAGIIVANPDWPNTNWIIRGNLPEGHVGKAAFAPDNTDGTCAAGGDHSGHFAIVSPTITVPTGATDLKLSFDHYVQTETGFDGGNLLVAINGGAFAVVPQDNYIFNPPNAQLTPAVNPGGNASTDPKAGEFAWTGANLTTGIGSWGTTIVDLSTLAHPGDTIQLKYDFGQDGCGGATGWFVDNVRVFNCPVLAAPTLSIGPDYENPDTNGSFTLNWIRPPGATGPDVLQVSQTSCAPLLFDNAENGLGNWTTTSSGTGAQNWTTSTVKPQHTGTTFFAQGIEGVTNADSYLTYKNPITIPATGQTFLNFSDWDDNEGDDNVYVEASENDGATWTPVYTHNRSEAGTAPASFASEPLFQRSVNLANYGGKTIRLRFRYSLGPDNRAASTPLGWYVDDIAITNDSWFDAASIAGTSFTDHRTSGTYCYRVRTTYTLAGEEVPSLYSNVVNVTVAPGVNPTPTPTPGPGGTATPTPTPGSTATPTPTGTATPTATPTTSATPSAAELQNLSTRVAVGTGDQAGIGGFMIQGTGSKQVVIRGIGPSLKSVPGRLTDPTLELHGRDGAIIAANDNWRSSQEAEITQSGLAPSDDRESAIVKVLDPGNYTAVIRGAGNTTGIGLVEIYDLDKNPDPKLGNVATRGSVDTGDNALIGGFILRGDNSHKVLVRALGPELTGFGVPGALQDTTIELRDVNGVLLKGNDDWKDTQQSEIEATGLAPGDNRESAIVQVLVSGNYTAVVRGKDNSVGVGLVEVYNLGNP